MREIGEIKEAITFIENHDEYQQTELWNDLIEYCVQTNSISLSKLLDYIGICHLDGILFMSSIPNNLHISQLKQRLIHLLSQYNHKVSCRQLLIE